jgi:uncharacterized protein (TIGR03437 family)
MKRLALLLAPSILWAQYVPQVAPGSLATISYSTSDNRSAPYSAVVSLRSVGSSTLIPAQVVAVDANTIDYVVPATAPAGPAEIIYKASGDTTKWVEVAVVPQSFTIQAAQVIAANGAARGYSLSNPAQPGESVVLWGSGLGLAPAANLAVTFGGVRQNILYAGAAPGLPGVNQINFQVSAAAPDGCYVPVTVTYGGQTATAYLSKSSNGGPCPHPFGLSAADLAALDAGNPLSVGQICTSSNIVAASADHASRQESASVVFTFWSASAIASAFEGGSSLSGCGSGGYYPPSIGSQSLSALALPDGSASFTTGDLPLAQLTPPVLTGGPWTWMNSGGSDLAASSFAFTLPPPISIAARVPLAWSSAQDQTITWNPAGYDSGAMVQASLAGNGIGGALVRSGVLSGVLSGVPGLVSLSSSWFTLSATGPTVTVPASAGTLTFPKALLAQAAQGANTLTVQLVESPFSVPSIVLHEKNKTTLLMVSFASTSETLPVDIQVANQ